MNFKQDDGPARKTKKRRHVKAQYMLWWRPDGSKKAEYGPLYNKKKVLQDTAYYKFLYGEENAGWYEYEDEQAIRRRLREERQRSRGRNKEEDW